MRITEDGITDLGVMNGSLILHMNDNFGGGSAALVFWDNAEETWMPFGSVDFAWTSGPVNKTVLGSRKYGISLTGSANPNIFVSAIDGE